MDIIKDLPFGICETCEECILDVDEKILFSSDAGCHRVITVGCRNAELCRKLKEKHNADTARTVHHSEGETVSDRDPV